MQKDHVLLRYGDPDNPTKGPNMEEDYVQLPTPGKQGVYGSATGRGAIGPLSPSHPNPLSRLILRDLKVLITLNQEAQQDSESGKHKVLAELQWHILSGRQKKGEYYKAARVEITLYILLVMRTLYVCQAVDCIVPCVQHTA